MNNKNNNRKHEKKTNSSIGISDNGKSGGFGQVIGGGTAVIRDKKPSFVPSMEDDGIVTDPFGSWTGVPVDDPYERPIQDADDL